MLHKQVEYRSLSKDSTRAGLRPQILKVSYQWKHGRPKQFFTIFTHCTNIMPLRKYIFQDKVR